MLFIFIEQIGSPLILMDKSKKPVVYVSLLLVGQCLALRRHRQRQQKSEDQQ
jgi:hypothetical protein